MPREHKRGVRGCTNYYRVWLNLEAIAFGGRGSNCSRQAGVWKQMLKTAFHEFAHIALKHWRIPSQKDAWGNKEWNFKHEQQADNQAEAWMMRILEYNDRLYQPDFLGVVDIVRRRREPPIKEIPRGSYFVDRLQSYRCHITGGQLSVSDVAVNLHIKSYEKRFKAYGLIHKIADDLARVHVDSAGRRHHFWVWGDIPVIARRLASCYEFHEFIERLKKEKEEHIKNLKNEEILF